MRVQVVYALPDRQWLREITLPAGATVEQAIRTSGVLEQHPGLVIGPDRVGIHGQLVPLDATLSEGDRVEIYRPLAADPKDIRRRRAARQRIR
jgi:hypothetical protein